MTTEHFDKLINMYADAPINEIYQPVMSVSEGGAEIEMDLSEVFFHAGGSLHGSVYFKMLDDAAYFAVSSLEQEYFMFTTSFTTYITRPVSEGKLRAVGNVVNKTNSQFIAESVVYDEANREVARGNGVFMRSKLLLETVEAYKPSA